MSNLIRSFKELTAEQQSHAGGKGSSLAQLYQAGFPVPDGFVILPAAFVDEALAPEAWSQVQDSLERLRSAGSETAFAVRSSAMSEDSAQASFAGEFETVLNVTTDEDIRQAIQTVYRSRQNERVQAYSQTKGLDAAHEIAVIIQQLVHAECSGVLFTAHPVTGQRDHAMISAAWGLGEAIVGGIVTPDTLIVDKTTGQVLDRETADKQVMTVRQGSGTVEQPVPETKRHAPVLSDKQAAELVQLSTEIETFFGLPMDIEWTWAEGKFAIVQARPITALPEPEPPVPTKWKLPKGMYSAMRNNIVELMTNPLTPLFDTMGRAVINVSLGHLLDNFFGRPGCMPEELIISVNQYAYYNGSLKPGQIVRILLGSIQIAKHMASGAVERWTEEGYPRYVETVQRWQNTPWQELPSVELFDASAQLAEAAIDAYGALVSGVLPGAWITEALFTMTHKLVARRDDPAAPTFLLGFDSVPIQAEKALYDLAQWIRGTEALAAFLTKTPAAQLASQLENGQSPPGVDPATWQQWQNRFQEHLQQYGHAIYNLDFSNPVPADDPVPVLETLKLFVNGQGSNPHARQQTSAEKREQATQAMRNRLRGLRRRSFDNALERAQRYAPLREDGLTEIGLSYPLLRQMLRELGRRLVEHGTIEQPDDIFWLYQEEVKQAAGQLDRGETPSSLITVVPQRKAAWRAARRATPPMMLPQIKLFGMDIMELKARKSGGKGNTLKGVAASPGQVTGPARVLNGPEDFDQMETGDVLVAPLTTPAWTPLFARAAAIVTDIGGPLSHGSIVAREYGIPAVLGTGAASKRIRSGQIITVDGDTGLVTLPESAT